MSDVSTKAAEHLAFLIEEAIAIADQLEEHLTAAYLSSALDTLRAAGEQPG